MKHRIFFPFPNLKEVKILQNKSQRRKKRRKKAKPRS